MQTEKLWGKAEEGCDWWIHDLEPSGHLPPFPHAMVALEQLCCHCVAGGEDSTPLSDAAPHTGLNSAQELAQRISSKAVV